LLPPNRRAWGKLLMFRRRSQLRYPGKKSLRPKTVFDAASYGRVTRIRPELDHDVPDVVQGVYDPGWQGSGNWVVQYCLRRVLKGLRAYVTRLGDLSEVEDWRSPTAFRWLSVCYNKLRGISAPPAAIWWVCVGFTSDGEVILNDPGTMKMSKKHSTRRRQLPPGPTHEIRCISSTRKCARSKDRFGHWAPGHATNGYLAKADGNSNSTVKFPIHAPVVHAGHS